MKFQTLTVHGGYDPLEDTFKSIGIPIYPTSNYKYEFLGQNLDFIYSRLSNPTVAAAEKIIANLEVAKFGLCFSSGMAATDTTFRALLSPGDEVLATEDLYGGNFKLLKYILPKTGISTKLINMKDLDLVKSSINSKSKIIFLESPTNPLLKIHNIENLAKIAKDHKILSVIDNTFATPAIQKPIKLGIDVVLHSATKYLGGHSDIIAGAAVTNSQEIYKKIRDMRAAGGAIMSPFTAFLLIRGIKTLSLRIKKQSKSAFKIAKKIGNHRAIKRVIYPFLKSNPDLELAKKQMKWGGGILTVEFHSESDMQKFLSKLKYFVLCESLAGVESQLNHSFTMSQSSMDEKAKKDLGISKSLIRISVGIENFKDLTNDLIRALDSI